MATNGRVVFRGDLSCHSHMAATKDGDNILEAPVQVTKMVESLVLPTGWMMPAPSRVFMVRVSLPVDPYLTTTGEDATF